MLSQVGGILGLFLGFSFMSAVELVYFFSLRFGINVVYKRDEDSEESENIDAVRKMSTNEQ